MLLAVDIISDKHKKIKSHDFHLNYSIRKIKIFDLKEIYLTFLLYFNEDFDDDLLQDALEVLNI